jgi:hypothetical protein
MRRVDLRVAPPRRWSDELGGVRWLPRLIDKCLAAHAGTLGTYLYGQSPVDRDLLRTLGMGVREFASIVREARDDAQILAELERRVPEGLERARAWSARAARRYGLLFFFLDVDEGRAGMPWSLMRAPVHAIGDVIGRAVQRRYPVRGIPDPEDRQAASAASQNGRTP